MWSRPQLPAELSLGAKVPVLVHDVQQATLRIPGKSTGILEVTPVEIHKISLFQAIDTTD